MKRICTTCASLGKRVEAKFVAAAERGPAELSELLWFECSEHGPEDNVAGVKRASHEPIADFFARVGIPFDALPNLDEDPPPPTERTPPVLEHGD